MKKYMKIITYIFIAFILIVTCIFSVMNNKNIRISAREINYKNNSNEENLSRLCIDLLYTNQYDKKIKYYPRLLYTDEFKSISKIIKSNVNIDNLFDNMQNEYIFSYLYINNIDEFKEKYVELFPKFKTVGPNYEYILTVINDKQITDKQTKVILEVLQSNLPLIKGDLLNEIGNLNTQSLIYEKLGDFKNQEVVDKQVEDIKLTLKHSTKK